ncbi:adenosine deaminase [Microlunatus speluncae]|uniref:adenosine deaminase n=1 Tax=Microlunatus speluncae TaxID=2594267 RepID=UPI001C2CF198|nr:adenosine deaminase [Microlunatus speluncae]
MPPDPTRIRDLARLPKANLHLHLTGSMRPATADALAARHGLPLLPPVDPDQPTPHGWEVFQDRYDAARAALRTAEDLERVVTEAIDDNQADGAGWVELQVDPTSYARHLGSLEAVIEAVLGALRDRPAGLIIAASWGAAGDHAERLAELAIRYAPEGVVGFGLSNDERLGRTADFVPAFRMIKDAGLLATPHAGFYHDAWHVREAVTLLGADRIGHGLTAVNDPALLDLLAERRVTLEVCPTSYPPFGVVTDLAAIPLDQLRRSGVPVALATDDPLIFGVGLTGQYEIARDHLGCTDATLADLAQQSIEASTAPPHLKTTLTTTIPTWLKPPTCQN